MSEVIFALVAGTVAAKLEVETRLMLFLLQQFSSAFCFFHCEEQKTQGIFLLMDGEDHPCPLPGHE